MRKSLLVLAVMAVLSAGGAVWGNMSPIPPAMRGDDPSLPPLTPPPTQLTSNPATKPTTQPLPVGVVPGAIALSAALALGGLYLARRNSRE
jgi:hypothetical protein